MKCVVCGEKCFGGPRLEIPTPRWTAYDAKYYGITDIPADVQMVAQQRAYTSPIWYTP